MKLFKFLNLMYVPGLAYLALLAAFAFLGGLVAALGAGSPLAIAAAIGLVATLVGAVAGFRAGSRKLGEAQEAGEPSNNVSIFSTPLREEEIQRYLESYRNDKSVVPQADPTMTFLLADEKFEHDARVSA